MAGINVDAKLGASGFVKGAKDMEEALDDVSEAMEDVAKSGDQDVDKLTDKLKEAKRAADDAANAGERIGKDYRKGTKEAENGLDDFRQEANSTAKESAASFDGSAESIVGSFQEIAANAFEGFGPAGAIAGLALAAGIGIATAEFQKSEEAAKVAKQRISELGNAMIDAGADGAVPLESIIENLKGIVTNSEDAVKQFKDIQKEAKEAGQDAGALATAYAGGTEALESQIDAYNDLIDAENEAMSKGVENGNRSVQTQSAQIEKYKDQRDALKGIQEEQKAAAEAEQAWLNSGGAEMLAKADAITQIDAAYDEAVYSVDNFKNAETGIYDLDAYAASIEERGRLLEEYQTNLAKSGLTTEQKAALNEMGVEQANAILKGLQDPNTSQATKDTIKKGLGTAAKEGSGVAEKEIKEAFKNPIEAKVQVKADTSMAQSDLDNLIKARTAIIKVDFQDRNGKRVY